MHVLDKVANGICLEVERQCGSFCQAQQIQQHEHMQFIYACMYIATSMSHGLSYRDKTFSIFIIYIGLFITILAI